MFVSVCEYARARARERERERERRREYDLSGLAHLEQEVVVLGLGVHAAELNLEGRLGARVHVDLVAEQAVHGLP